MVSPDKAIASLVPKEKKAINKETMIPPPPTPLILLKANKMVKTITPTISIGFCGKTDLWTQILSLQL